MYCSGLNTAVASRVQASTSVPPILPLCAPLSEPPRTDSRRPNISIPQQTGPLQLIEAGLVGDIEALGWKVDFAGADKLSQSITAEGNNGSDPDIGKLKQPRLVSQVRRPGLFCRLQHRMIGLTSGTLRLQVNKEVAERVYAHSSKGELTVTLGGDHSLVSEPGSGSMTSLPC